MKSFFKPLGRQTGFTLVELMVVVAIIGLLSAVAIPNFKKYQAKSKVSEAKLQLSAAYTAEQSFFSDFNIYAGCLPYMGFDPAYEYANRYYAVGFSAATTSINGSAYTAAMNSGLDSTATTGCENGANLIGGTGAKSDGEATYFIAGKGIGGAIASTQAYIPSANIGDQSETAKMTFTIGAGGIISSDFTASTDASQLTVSEKKVFRTVRNGF